MDTVVKRLSLVLLMPVLFALPAAEQQSTPTFWELRPEQISRMLLPLPENNQDRYTRLRQYFSDLHCGSKLTDEQLVGKQGEEDLICVLPGKSPQQIIVAARYDRRWAPGGVVPGWNEAVMLPILYNALLAQTRERTFVFVALSGNPGQIAFFDRLRKQRGNPPLAVVALDMLGLGTPWFYASSVSWAASKKRERREAREQLLSEATNTGRVTGAAGPSDVPLTPVQDSLLIEAGRIPAILVCSHASGIAPDQAFRQDFEFLAYFLCRIDAKLASPRSSPE